MEYRPRVVVALHDRAESAAVADWLAAKGFEPLPRFGVRAVVDELGAQASDLLITDAEFAVALLPPAFNVRIPLVGVSVAVQRVWGRRAKPGASTTWYGGALTQNTSATEQGWRSFVDTVPLVHTTPRTAPGLS